MCAHACVRQTRSSGVRPGSRWVQSFCVAVVVHVVVVTLLWVVVLWHAQWHRGISRMRKNDVQNERMREGQQEVSQNGVIGYTGAR